MHSHSPSETRFQRTVKFLSLAFCTIVPYFAIADEGPLRVAIVGDSTVASYAKPPAARPDLTGWGQVFGEFFDAQVTVLNQARSGRSSKSFLGEGLWDQTLALRPDYIFIQFGHNDCPGKGDRETDPATDFRDNLRKYIADARRIDAIPILVTPMTRRQFRGGQIHTILRPYAEAMLTVGKEEHVAVIDLHHASVELFNRLGDDGSSDFSASANDRTHFSRKGALAMAKIVAEGVQTANDSLSKHLLNSGG
ncbi:MAG: rhamnogalacturonan acetylesterase [Planctomycetaceae bacterium]|nr:rhamnogalacturonan acetylesterase [Planctomycetales bacterium]MCB9921243.1 rhamnogalacturonan acetylesterase [Planctomycetaceae bacterium]